MAQPVFVSMTRLADGTAISVDATDQIANLVAVPATKLPAGVVAGTYIFFVSGRVLPVRGYRSAIASQLGVSLSGFSNAARISTAGAFLTKAPFFATWAAARTSAGLYTLSAPAGTIYPQGFLGLIVTCETAALYANAGQNSIVTDRTVISIRTNNEAGTPTDSIFDILVYNGLT